MLNRILRANTLLRETVVLEIELHAPNAQAS